MQQRLRNELRSKEQAIDEYFDQTEETVDKYHAFFDEKNNENYLTELREEQRQITEKEIMDGYKSQNEQKQLAINASKMNDKANNNNNEENSSEEEEMNDLNVKMTLAQR